MRLQVKGKNVEVSESVRKYAEKRLGKLEKQLADPTQVELELAMERNPAIAANHVAEATIWTKGPTLRAREAATGWEASIDQLVDKLERQVVRYREKRKQRNTRGNHARGAWRTRTAARRGAACRAQAREDEAIRDEADVGRGGEPSARARRPRLLRVRELGVG